MREVKFDRITFEINGLTRKAFKTHKLEKYGYGFFGQKQVEGIEPEECIFKFIEISIQSGQRKELENLTPCQMMELYKECTAETYGSRDEEKNSQVSGTD